MKLIAGLVVLILIVFFVVFFAKNKTATKKISKDAYYQKLLSKTMGNKEQAERLIELERQRNPNAGRAELIKLAVERWEYHNR